MTKNKNEDFWSGFLWGIGIIFLIGIVFLISWGTSEENKKNQAFCYPDKFESVERYCIDNESSLKDPQMTCEYGYATRINCLQRKIITINKLEVN